jgi:hypothetical protein
VTRPAIRLSLVAMVALCVASGLALHVISEATAQAQTIVEVDSQNPDGVRTGIVVNRGQTLQFAASGSWCMGGQPPTAECGGPGGIRTAHPIEQPLVMPRAPFGALLGRIGDVHVLIGSSATLTAPADDELVLLFNDRTCCYGDNSGRIIVMINWIDGSNSTPTPSPAPRPPDRPRYQEAVLDPNDESCIPNPGERLCEPERDALWNGDRAAWSRRGVVDQPPFTPFNGRVFEATVEFRIQAGSPPAIRNRSGIRGIPYLKVTRIRFVGPEFFEITNLGGAAADLSRWTIRSRNAAFDLPDGFILGAGEVRRFQPPVADMFPDDEDEVSLWIESLGQRVDAVRYSADPANQPPPPNLQGVP